jgi:hypothetical protein
LNKSWTGRNIGNAVVRYWWVNQNQTFRQEIDGGYLWSPKRNKNGHRNLFYEFKRLATCAWCNYGESRDQRHQPFLQ